MEKNNYLTKQIITYMGNKRKLLAYIDNVLDDICEELQCDILTSGDGFSGSGIVSRLLKRRSKKLYTNDIAGYSKTLNTCYLSTPTSNMRGRINTYIDTANDIANNTTEVSEPWISKHWSPKDSTILESERAYFTRDNAVRIDAIRDYIETIPVKYRDHIKAPLLVESSIHNNTNGQFSAFYKDGNNIGKYGGKKEIDIKRITQQIKLPYPIYDTNKCDIHVSQMDTNEWVKKIPEVDVVYYDPPYNKHPYDIYYFMLDIINNWNKELDIPNTNRGQPNNRTKSKYNSSIHAESALIELLSNTQSKYILLSYNDKGIIPISKMDTILKIFNNVQKIPIDHKVYNRLKGISNYKRDKEYANVKEYLYVIQK